MELSLKPDTYYVTRNGMRAFVATPPSSILYYFFGGVVYAPFGELDGQWHQNGLVMPYGVHQFDLIQEDENQSK